MKSQPDLKKILKKGQITNELELERASIIDRKLRLLIKEHPEFAKDRKQLRKIIHEYEKNNWSKDSVISDEKIKESDLAEGIAERERQFIERRKNVIKDKLSKYSLTQQDLGVLLGHNKSYMSELMNGISPLNTRDLVIIHQLFHIKLEELIPTIINQTDRCRIKASMEKIKKPGLLLTKEVLILDC
jgi:transcriptional regulator with XRE-family HTH domain